MSHSAILCPNPEQPLLGVESFDLLRGMLPAHGPHHLHLLDSGYNDVIYKSTFDKEGIGREMDQAKAVINVKEGVIQLEGPVEFVRQYLELYGSAIGGVKEQPMGEKPNAAPATAKVAKSPKVAEKEVAVHGKRRRAKRLTCIGAIRKEIKGGFFNEPRPATEVHQRLFEQGMSCGHEIIRVSLVKLTGDGLLERTSDGRSARYRRQG